jgi:hypothetical protein
VKEFYFKVYFHRCLRTRCPNGGGINDKQGSDKISDNSDEMNNGEAEILYDNETDSNLAAHGRSSHNRFFQILDSRLTRLFNLIADDSLQKFKYVVSFSIDFDPSVNLNMLAGI